MYLYYDSEGRLQEFINFPVRQGEEEITYMYVYMEDNANLMAGDMFKFPVELFDRFALYAKLPEYIENVTNEAKILINPISGQVNDFILKPTIEADIPQMYIPYSKRRDLKYFKYFRKYQFLKIPLTKYPGEGGLSTYIFENNGDVVTSLFLYERLSDAVKALQPNAFTVEEGALVKSIYITQSQYSYLLSMIGNATLIEGAVRTVNGKSPDIETGNVELYGTDIKAYQTEAGETEAPTIINETSRKVDTDLNDVLTQEEVLNILMYGGGD